jgi:hypothetical protein
MRGEDDMNNVLDFAARRYDQMPPTGGTNPMDFGETAIARRFAAATEGKLVYDHDDRRWFV